VARLLPQLVERIESADFPPVDHTNPIRKSLGYVKKLGGIKDGSAAAGRRARMALEGVDAVRVHSRGEWLIQEPYFPVCRQHGYQGGLVSLTARERAHRSQRQRQQIEIA